MRGRKKARTVSRDRGEERHTCRERACGLTARHVMQAFSNFDRQIVARRRSTGGFFARDGRSDVLKTTIAATVYQENEGRELVQWWPRVSWQSEDTDISVLVLHPRTATAETRARTLEYLEWQLLPPRVGAKVSACRPASTTSGWPRNVRESRTRGRNHDHFHVCHRPLLR